MADPSVSTKGSQPSPPSSAARWAWRPAIWRVRRASASTPTSSFPWPAASRSPSWSRSCAGSTPAPCASTTASLSRGRQEPRQHAPHCQEGLQPTVRDLLYLMITLSDNTAHRHALAASSAWRAVNDDHARARASTTIDCMHAQSRVLPHRVGAGSDWRGLAAPRSSPDGAPSRRDGARDGALRDASSRRTRVSAAPPSSISTTAALGPRRVARLRGCLRHRPGARQPGVAARHGRAAGDDRRGRCASAPSCRLMLEIISRQKWRDKIPAGLPPGLLVANKTGGVAGTSNDAAIVYTPSGAPIVMVVYCKGLSYAAQAAADGHRRIAADCTSTSESRREGRRRRILVVGGVRRPGRALALDLAAHGAAVCVSSRARARGRTRRSAALRAPAPPRPPRWPATCADPRTAAALVGRGRGRARRPGRAGVRGQRTVRAHPARGASTRTSWDASLDTIAKGFFFAACAAREQFVRRTRGAPAAMRGVIVADHRLPGPAALGGLRRARRRQGGPDPPGQGARASLGPDGVRVCGVAPGPVDSDDEHRAATLRAAAKVALGTPGEPGGHRRRRALLPRDRRRHRRQRRRRQRLAADVLELPLAGAQRPRAEAQDRQSGRTCPSWPGR